MFGRVQLQRAEPVFEIKGVNNNAGLIGKGAGLDDVHSPGGKHSRDGGKQEWLVGSYDGEFIEIARVIQRKLHGVAAQLFRHLHLRNDLLRGVASQISLRQPFQEALHLVFGFMRFVRLALVCQRADTLQRCRLGCGVEAVFIHAAIQVIGGCDIKLP